MGQEQPNWPDFLLAIFSGRDAASPIFFGADFMREFIVAIIIFLIGWAAAQRSSAKHKKAAFANELIGVQRRLLDHAYPLPKESWNANGRREVQDLAPLSFHLEFAHGIMKSEEALSEQETVIVDEYISAVNDFIHNWAETYSRRDWYHKRFETTMRKLGSVLEAISTTKRAQWRALDDSHRERRADFASRQSDQLSHEAPELS